MRQKSQIFLLAILLFFIPGWADDTPVHGYFDASFKNDYITPRGLLVTDTDLTIQILAGLVVDFSKKVSLEIGCWNDVWTGQDNPTVGAWNEFDWYIGLNCHIADDWRFLVHYLQFLSPPGNFKPENNMEFTLAYDDSKWGYRIVWNPYVKWFWAMSGSSTVVVGRPGNTYDVEIGLVPTIKMMEYFVLTAPTWITVGPPSFWNGGDLGLKHKRCCLGVFTSGLNVKMPYRNWYLDIGGQYYYLINDSLLQAQTVTLGVHSYKKGHRHVGVASAGFGFGF